MLSVSGRSISVVQAAMHQAIEASRQQLAAGEAKLEAGRRRLFAEIRQAAGGGGKIALPGRGCVSEFPGLGFFGPSAEKSIPAKPRPRVRGGSGSDAVEAEAGTGAADPRLSPGQGRGCAR